ILIYILSLHDALPILSSILNPQVFRSLILQESQLLSKWSVKGNSVDRLILSSKRRYLVQFHPKRVPHMFVDVLVIGGGIAGTRRSEEHTSELQSREKL